MRLQYFSVKDFGTINAHKVSMHFATFLQALFMSERSVTLEVLASDSPKSAVRYTLGKLAPRTIPVIEDLWITFTPSNSTTQKP